MAIGANNPPFNGRRIARIAYPDDDNVSAYLVKHIATGRLAMELDGDLSLPVSREHLPAFMAWHGLRVEALCVDLRRAKENKTP